MVVQGNTFFLWDNFSLVTHREWGFREAGTEVFEPKELTDLHSFYRGETDAREGWQGCLVGFIQQMRHKR